MHRVKLNSVCCLCCFCCNVLVPQDVERWCICFLKSTKCELSGFPNALKDGRGKKAFCRYPAFKNSGGSQEGPIIERS